MKKIKIKSRKYSNDDWVPEYIETSMINNMVVSNPKSPSAMHFKSKEESDKETLKILKEQGESEDDIEIADHVS